MAVKIYNAGASIITENVYGQDLKQAINSAQFDWQKTGNKYFVRDNIEKKTYELGVFPNIQNEAGTPYSSDTELETALNGFVNLSVSTASSNGDIAKTQIQTLDKDAISKDVSQSFGLGIRQHDDVMLSYGYSYFTRLEATVLAGNFQILRLDVNDVDFHHVEERMLATRNESLRFKVYDITENLGLLPANPQPMDIVNQNQQSGNNLSIGKFFSYAPQGTNPFSALPEIDNVPIWIASQSPNRTIPAQFPNSKGRHYNPNSVYVGVIENIEGGDTEMYYQYSWHEYKS